MTRNVSKLPAGVLLREVEYGKLSRIKGKIIFLLTKDNKKLYNYIMKSGNYSLKGSLVLLAQICLFIPGLLPNAISKDMMEIKRDENKTVYTIGSSQDKKDGKTEDEKDKERAWDMLKHMNIIIDQRNQGGQQ